MKRRAGKAPANRTLETFVEIMLVVTEIRKLFVCNTRIGPFYVAEIGGRFHPIYEDQSLGSYARPEQAAEDTPSQFPAELTPPRWGYQKT
jgi:hypothetical protein